MWIDMCTTKKNWMKITVSRGTLIKFLIISCNKLMWHEDYFWSSVTSREEGSKTIQKPHRKRGTLHVPTDYLLLLKKKNHPVFILLSHSLFCSIFLQVPDWVTLKTFDQFGKTENAAPWEGDTPYKGDPP